MKLFFTSPRRTGSVLVALQFGLLLGLGALAGPALRAGALPWPCLLLALWSSVLGGWTLMHNRLGNFNIHPEPRKGGVMVRSGPYRWIRHPMYTAVLLMAAAVAVLGPLVLALPLWGALCAVLWGKSALEERWLCEHHPAYDAYRRQTSRFVPGLW